MTVRSLRDPRNLSAVVRLKPTIIRLGIEGISERIRSAFAKPISDAEVLDVFQRISESSIPVCLFYVVAAPFEDDGDREQFRAFNKALAARVTRGGHRIKCTTFTPVPPAPLSRYVCPSALVDSFEEFDAWRFANANDRHILWVRHRGADAQTRTEADTLDVPLTVLRDWKASEGPFDLAPSLQDFQRMKSEIIAWPFTAEQRFRAAERYRKMMTQDDG